MKYIQIAYLTVVIHYGKSDFLRETLAGPAAAHTEVVIHTHKTHLLTTTPEERQKLRKELSSKKEPALEVWEILSLSRLQKMLKLGIHGQDSLRWRKSPVCGWTTLARPSQGREFSVLGSREGSWGKSVPVWFPSTFRVQPGPLGQGFV